MAEPGGDGARSVRVFDLLEELPFAGHPLIGAAAAVHHRHAPGTDRHSSVFLLGERWVRLDSMAASGGYRVSMDQGEPMVRSPAQPAPKAAVAAAFSLRPEDLHDHLPIELASTGLVYLVVPVREHVLERARVAHDLTELVSAAGAEFAVLFDPAAGELRHWNNDGLLEDSATGSAAGALAAYAVRHGVVPAGEVHELRQGRIVGRPSVLRVASGDPASDGARVRVTGDVVVMGRGELLHGS